MRQIALTAFGLVVMTIANASPVAACYCVSRSTEEAFEVSEDVFFGQVIEVSGPRVIRVGPHTMNVQIAKFFVWQQWKGAKALEIELLFEVPTNSCSTDRSMKAGETYMVFADRFSVKDISPKIQGLVTTCTNTYRITGPNPHSEFISDRAVLDAMVMDKLGGSRPPLRTPAFGRVMTNKCLCLSN